MPVKVVQILDQKKTSATHCSFSSKMLLPYPVVLSSALGGYFRV